MKLTKKQNEIVNKLKQLESEAKETVYLMFNEFSKKIHAVTIEVTENNEVITIENKGIICTHNVAASMEQKGILLTEVVGKRQKYFNSPELHDFTLCKINPDI
jgi:hypothetical protein